MKEPEVEGTLQLLQSVRVSFDAAVTIVVHAFYPVVQCI